MTVAGICVVLKADLGFGGNPDMNLGRKTPHHIPKKRRTRVSCTSHLSRAADH